MRDVYEYLDMKQQKGYVKMHACIDVHRKLHFKHRRTRIDFTITYQKWITKA